MVSPSTVTKNMMKRKEVILIQNQRKNIPESQTPRVLSRKLRIHLRSGPEFNHTSFRRHTHTSYKRAEVFRYQTTVDSYVSEANDSNTIYESPKNLGRKQSI